MRGRLPFFIYLSITLSILTYTAVRLMLSDTAVRRVSIYSDTGRIDEGVRQLIVNNAKNIRNIPATMLESFPNIDNVSVRNNRNGLLEVRIRHKKVVGIWQSGDKFYPLLEDGTRINTPYPARPRVPDTTLFFRGEVPENVGDIIRLVSREPELMRMVGHLEFIENRRWNITLKNGAVIMLPEQNIEGAFGQLRQLGVLGKPFTTLDLRDPGRTLVR